MPGVSKVVYDNEVLIDLTGDTVVASALLEGYTAHQMNGDKIVGTYKPGTPAESDDWINRALTAGLVDGYKEFSDDGTIISTTDMQGRVLTKEFSNNFDICTTTLYGPDSQQLGQTVTTISEDCSTVTTTDSKGQKLVKTFSPDFSTITSILTNAAGEQLAKMVEVIADNGSVTSTVEYGPASL